MSKNRPPFPDFLPWRFPHEDALALTDEIAFFQAVRARLLKFEGEDGDDGSKQNYETAIRQIVNQAVESTEVIDIFDAAGIKKPDISLLSEEFLQDVKEMKHKNLGSGTPEEDPQR